MKDTQQLHKLTSLLDESIIIAGQFKGKQLHYYLDPESFQKEIKTITLRLKNNELDVLNTLYNWFDPYSEWHNEMSEEGKVLGNKIHEIVSELIAENNSGDIYALIKDYQDTANKAVSIFKQKYNVENLLEGWHSRLYSQTGDIKELGIKFYAFHGIGLATHFQDKVVDFDFAFFPEQRHDGFDLWRLKGFVSNQPLKYSKFLNSKLLEKDFNNLVSQNIIYNPKLEHSTNLYFWTGNHTAGYRKKAKSWWKFWQ